MRHAFPFGAFRSRPDERRGGWGGFGVETRGPASCVLIVLHSEGTGNLLRNAITRTQGSGWGVNSHTSISGAKHHV